MSLIRNTASTHEKIRLQYIGRGLSKKKAALLSIVKIKTIQITNMKGIIKFLSQGRWGVTFQYGVFLPPLIGSLEWPEQVLGQLVAFALVVKIFLPTPYFIHPVDTEYCI
jgi:hypothetical protein